MCKLKHSKGTLAWQAGAKLQKRQPTTEMELSDFADGAFFHKKADPCIAQGPAHQNKTKNQLFILEGRMNG
jgi:hypothetical protein